MKEENERANYFQFYYSIRSIILHSSHQIGRKPFAIDVENGASLSMFSATEIQQEKIHGGNNVPLDNTQSSVLELIHWDQDLEC